MNGTRRRFLASAAQFLALSTVTPVMAKAAPKARKMRSERAKLALERRIAAAKWELERDFPEHLTNGDEAAHDPAWVCYSKGLPHEAGGTATKDASKHLWHAVQTRKAEDFEDVPLGGYIKLANPQAAFAFDLCGPDAQQIAIAPPPAFSSARQAAEMVEMYWHALTRDVPFDRYESDPLIARAATELSALRSFDGPREGAAVTPRTLFRGNTQGGLAGPYISQFLWRDLPWTPIRVAQKIRIAAPEKDYLTSWPEWLNVQNGNVYPVNDYEATPRYIRTARDLGEYVHRDFTYQAFLGACLMLFRMNAPLDGGFRYQYSISQSGFVTLGASDILHAVAMVANIALKAAWFQKWALHRRLRPEEYGARVDRHASGAGEYPLHLDLLNATALSMTKAKFGSYLLPQAYPEGSPLHPAYPSGHAVIAGACATVLKACFAETFVIPNPQVPSEDGLTLQPYRGELMVRNELDKLAENLSYGRNAAGIHWRTDASEGLRLGEQVAINVLRETRMMSDELTDSFTLTTFDGKRVEIR
ncbi:MAG TPA: vanadium-dependent haloperoxidase [Thermoanaerobaculia bacterium]|nr:vanadium-dependent haloperoxidase [Thermoanaerobaculia bacterium]